MIYIKNTKEIQTIFIPRTELEKDSYVVSVKSYDEGYADGIVEGKKLQKLKLTNLTVTENGVYKREDGWNEVEVDVETGATVKTQQKTLYVTKNTDVVLPDAGYDALTKVVVNATQYGQNKRNEGYEDGYSRGTEEGYQSGYDKGKLDAGNEGYNEGYNKGYGDGYELGNTNGYNDGYELGNTNGYNAGKTDGIAIQKNKLTNLSVTTNGTYNREDGWNKVVVSVPSTTFKTQQKNLTVTKDNETVLPDNGYDGITRVNVDATKYGQNKHNEGYNKGYGDGYDLGFSEGQSMNTCEFTDLDVVPNWDDRDYNNCITYNPSNYDADGFSSVKINISKIYNVGYQNGITNTPVIGGKIRLYDYGNKFTNTNFDALINWFDFKGITDMEDMFYSCEQLTNIDYIDTSSAITMKNMFNGCINLKKFILKLDTSNVTDMSYMFMDCHNLTSIPQLDTSKVIDMRYMFNNCYKLESIPQMDTSNITDMTGMFSGAGITSVPQMDTSNVTNMYETFALSKITTIPQLNTSKVNNMHRLFYNCYELESIPQLNTSNVTNMGYMFSGCEKLISVPQLDTSKVTNMGNMFSGCINLTSIPSLKAYSLERADNVFGNQNLDKLTDFGGFEGLRVSCNINMLPNLSYQSCMNILDGLYDFTGNGQIPSSSQGKLRVHPNFVNTVGSWNMMLAEEKGWTIITE